MNIGERIKTKRKQKKMTADKLGELIGKDRATIYRYEKNEIENVPYTLISKIAEVLDVEESYLMGWDKKEEKTLPSTQYEYFNDLKISAGVPTTVEGTHACTQFHPHSSVFSPYRPPQTLYYVLA